MTSRFVTPLHSLRERLNLCAANLNALAAQMQCFCYRNNEA